LRILKMEVRRMITAKDVMTEDVVFVKTDTPIYEVLGLLIKHNISGIPVVEDDMTLVAIVSERDVLRLWESNEDVAGKTAGDYMTQPAVSFEEQESLSEVCECLINNYFRRVPITSKGVLVGIVSRRDIIKNIVQRGRQSVALDRETHTTAGAAE